MHLVNGAFSLAEPLRVEFSKAAWTGPVSNDTVDIKFKQLIKANDPLRTGHVQQDADVHAEHHHAVIPLSRASGRALGAAGGR